MVPRLALLCMLFCLAMAGCTSKPPSASGAAQTAYVPAGDQHARPGRDKVVVADNQAFARFGRAPGGKEFGSLAGRTLEVSSLSEIRLADKEVILTFDDGPMPGKTDRVLEILDQFGVKATFFMVGQMANSYPAVAARVVNHGHSVGGHTYNHANLASTDTNRALADIATGNAAVTRATGAPIGFFRFPYLADTVALRNSVAARGMVILDVDIDTKDYFKLSPQTIAARTMAQLRDRRKGVILMHDIHHRTAAMLPLLLSQLRSGGYKVVALQYRRSRMPEAMVSAGTVRGNSRQM
ncbi:peptidoglycan/xylan/chitin deacetylase (PgdA/CDA1 family) [Hoeflea halophila]|uniref:Chitooligosaccharide deacetylase n=1 Tax=Hoeflea halophila TaxID=714899 RepID=A0A286IBS2_9HYPH|nr:polysaccharide deacetylase family protein [Hoeflea halophila]SOE17575.1 peptidoglycan/xylan/chitin deacetylase (PgdA/CDA1 family) [Hoeflea halophila]